MDFTSFAGKQKVFSQRLVIRINNKIVEIIISR